MAILVRAASVADARRIAEIHVAGWRTAYRGHMPDALLDALSVAQRTAHWTRRIGTPPTVEHRTWVACDGVSIDGFAGVGPTRDADPGPGVVEIYAIYVDPARWGTGAGRALTLHVLADFRARGFREVALWVLDGNLRARRFYETAGFAADGQEKTEEFGGRALREIRYRQTLPG